MTDLPGFRGLQRRCSSSLREAGARQRAIFRKLDRICIANVRARQVAIMKSKIQSYAEVIYVFAVIVIYMNQYPKHFPYCHFVVSNVVKLCCLDY